MTNEELQQLLTKPGYAIAGSTHKSVDPVPDSPGASGKDAQLERAAGHGPLAAQKVKGGDPRKFSVVVTSYRRRLLDEDNLSEKYFCDCLRYAGIIPGDTPEQATIKARQVKVKTAEEEKTVIEIAVI
jgi:hypothetical protein